MPLRVVTFDAMVHRTCKVVGVHKPNDSTTSVKQRIATLISGSVKADLVVVVIESKCKGVNALKTIIATCKCTYGTDVHNYTLV